MLKEGSTRPHPAPSAPPEPKEEKETSTKGQRKFGKDNPTQGTLFDLIDGEADDE